MGRSFFGQFDNYFKYFGHTRTHARTLTRYLMRTLIKAYVLVTYIFQFSMPQQNDWKLLELLSSVHLVFSASNVDQCNSDDYFHCICREFQESIPGNMIEPHLPQQRYGITFFVFLNFLTVVSVYFIYRKLFEKTKKFSVKKFIQH